MKKTTLIFLFFGVFPLLLPAQNTFKAGLVAGMNAAQIDGDLLAGYNKIGFHAGGRVSVQTGKLWHVSLEMLYAQKGSRSSTQETFDQGSFTEYGLDYIEIPVMMNYIDGGFFLNAGFSYDRLVRVREMTVADIDFLDLEGQSFRQNNVNFVAGIGYFFTTHWGAELRYSYSPFSIIDYKNSANFDQAFISKLLTLRAVYLF